MKRILVAAPAAGLLLSFLAAPAAAGDIQNVELGYDFGFSFLQQDAREYPWGEVAGRDVAVVGIPKVYGFVPAIRVGLYLTDHSEVEPSFGFQVWNIEGNTYWQTLFGVDYLHNLGHGGTRPYLRAGGVQYIDDAGFQYGLGAGLGAKTDLAERLALRYELGAARQFASSEMRARWDLGLSVGVSFFTR